MRASVSVRGVERLAGLNDENLTRAAASALRTALETAAEDARRRCPEDTGALRESIGVRMQEAGGRATGAIFASAPHAKAVELGTLHRRAQPFLYPAWRENAASIRRAVQMRVCRALKGEDEA